MTLKILSKSFYERSTLIVAQDLIGKYLVHEQSDGSRLVGRIVETEAYLENDPACHAWSSYRRKLKGLPPRGRSQLLFGEPGNAYVYLNYGIHWLFNVVTEPEGIAGAVLIRALEPVEGIEMMEEHRQGKKSSLINLTSGPGRLSQAFGIDVQFNGMPLWKAPLYIAENTRKSETPANIQTSRRIGISKAIEKPWRYFDGRSLFVSKPSKLL